MTSPGPPQRPPATRLGDADRDVAARALRYQHACGRLTLEEVLQRLPLALQARTAIDLEPLFADLPADGPPPGRVPGRRERIGSPRRVLVAVAAAAAVTAAGWIASPARTAGATALPMYHCTVCVDAALAGGRHHPPAGFLTPREEFQRAVADRTANDPRR